MSNQTVDEAGAAAKASIESQDLRFEIKNWERSFSVANHGRKPRRDEIAQYPEIVSKYRAYNRLKLLASGCIPTPPTSSSPAPSDSRPIKKRRISNSITFAYGSTPPKSKSPQNSSSTFLPLPLKVRQATDAPTLDQLDSVRSKEEVADPFRNVVGPTPQKNGKILGLFDLLSPSSSQKAASATPSKRTSLAAIAPNDQVTPLKNKIGAVVNVAAIGFENVSSNSGQKTPSSISKRTQPVLKCATPSVQRREESLNDGTPSSRCRVSMLRFDATPEFLRRDGQRLSLLLHREVDGEKHANAKHAGSGTDRQMLSWSPVAVRMPPRPAGKGLSTLVKGLRGLEDERLDEELELLKEMEGNSGTSKEAKPRVALKLVEGDSPVDVPLGPDGNSDYETESAKDSKEALGRDGRPLKVWKKKGQKRTTRRITMKPSNAKWEPEAEWKGRRDSDEEDERLTLNEAQVVSDSVESKRINTQTLDGFGETNGESRGRDAPSEKLAQKKPRKTISSTAHANFRALNIKNKNSKSKGKGRFGRRR